MFHRDPNTCDHLEKLPGGHVQVEHPYTGEVYYEWQNGEERSTTEELQWGRFRCTQCGHVMYYTGLWKKYWEEGIPCAGSSLVPKHLRPANLQGEEGYRW